MNGSETATAAPISFYFDFASPYAYLVSGKIDDMAKLYGRTVDWKPILLGVVFKETGASPLFGDSLKGRYAQHDMKRMARLLGEPLVFPDYAPFASIAAARAIYWIKDQDADQARAVAKALLTEAWAEGGDIRQAPDVVRIASELGVDGEALAGALKDQAVKDRLRQEIDDAMAAGVCGSPFFIVDGEPFWGSDRLDQVERWLATGGW